MLLNGIKCENSYRDDFFLKGLGAGKPEKGMVLILADNSSQDLYRTIALEAEEVRFSALNSLREHLERKIDVLVLDCAVDVKTGLRFLDIIKSGRKDVPVIFVTRDASKEAEAEALRLGARFCFTGPVNIFYLTELIRKLLHVKRSSRERRSQLSFEALNQHGKEDLLSNMATTDKPAGILRVIRHIEENLSEKLSLDALAEKAHMSKFHFCRFFFRYTGMTPLRFVTHVRIEKAKEYLKNDASVSEIAFQVGFNDLGSFIRQFKRSTGMTPSAFQAIARENACRVPNENARPADNAFGQGSLFPPLFD
jgi:AraC family transcriptional regulator